MLKYLCSTASTLLLLLPEAVLAQAGAPDAPASPAAQPSFLESLMAMVPMFIIVFFIFYFLVLRPQERRAREHEQLLGSLKKGDEVVTSSGFLGRVAGIEKDYILVELANNVRVRLLKGFVSKKVEKEEGGSSSKKKSA